MCANNYLQFCQLWKWHFISLPFCWSIPKNLISLFYLYSFKSLRHSTFLRFWFVVIWWNWTVLPDTKNGPQILYFASFFHKTPKLINYNQISIESNNCSYTSARKVCLTLKDFKYAQKSAIKMCLQGFDFQMG